MQWTGKLVGGAVGAFLGLGPFGIALGAFLGHQYDLKSAADAAGGPRAGIGVGPQFFASTFRVMGHVAKADGRVTEREIEAARGIMHSLRLDAVQVGEAIAFFNAGKQPGFGLDDEIARLRAACGLHPGLLQMFLEIQLRFALAGNDMSGPVRERVTRIGLLLGYSAPMMASLEAALRGGRPGFRPADSQASVEARTVAAYRVLEVEASISDAELVKAYRRQMSRHHPDKLKANGLPDSMLEHAKERTQQIREAYEFLRERRGIA
jgi:DnaJ like chaperone protein